MSVSMMQVTGQQLLDAYTTDQGIPLGTIATDVRGNLYRWVKRTSGTLAAKLALVSLGTNRLLANSLVALPGAADQPFAGARVSGATSLDATNAYGWIQISGEMTLVGDNTVQVDLPVSIAGTSGKIKTADAVAIGKFHFGVATADDASDGADVVVLVGNPFQA